MDVESAHAELAAGLKDPWDAYAVLTRAGTGVHRNPSPERYPGLGSVGVYRREPIMAVVGDPAKFTNRLFSGTPLGAHDPADPRHVWVTGIAGRQMMFTDPPEHTRLRRILAPSFNRGAIRRWSPMVSESVDAVLDEYEPGQEVDFTQVAMQVPIRVISAIIGVPVDSLEQRERLSQWSRAMAATLDLSVQGVEPGQPRDRALHGEAELLQYLQELLIERRARPCEDLISQMAQATDDDGTPFADDEVLAQLLPLYSAGNTTTVDMIANGADLLLDPEYPERLEWLRESPEPRAPQFVEEVLRFFPSVHYDVRMATCDTSLGGIDIEKGDMVLLYLPAANRDPRQFDSPHRFRPERPNAKNHLSFTPGSVHHCIGAPLARVEGRAFFHRLVERFPEMARAGAPVRRHHAGGTRGLESLPVRL